MDDVRELIRGVVDSGRTTYVALSTAAGKNQAYIHQFVTRGTPRTLPEDVREKIAPLMGVDPSQLRSRSKSVLSQSAAPVSEVRRAPERLDLLGYSKGYALDVPVLGIAVGGSEADFYLNGQTIDYVRRPPGIANLKDVFAIYVAGSSMHPRFEEGELVYATAVRPPRQGDYVLVEMHASELGEPGAAFLKRFQRRAGSHIICQQFNPPADLEYEFDEIKRIYRVIPTNELMGV